MTYVKPAEQTFLSSSGHWVVVLAGKILYLIRTKDGSFYRTELPHRVTLAALDPTDQYLVVAGSSWLAVQKIDQAGRWLAEATAPSNLYQLKLSEGGLLLGISHELKTQSSYLQIWHAENLTPLWASPGQNLGSVFVQGLYTSSQQTHFLQRGVEAFKQKYSTASGEYVESTDFAQTLQGIGKIYCRLNAFNSTGLETLWSSDKLEFIPNGFLMPLAREGLGVYDLESLTIFGANPPDYKNWLPHQKYSLPGDGGGAILASSPNGQYIIALYGYLEAGQARHCLEISQVNNGLGTEAFTYTRLNRANFEELGHFPNLAIDNQAQATVVFSNQSGQIQLLRFEAGSTDLTTLTVYLA